MFILSQVPFAFRGAKLRVDWFLLIEHTKRIDFAILYLTYCINFLILTYALHYRIKVGKFITRLVFTISILDLIHYLTLAKQGFGVAKIGVAFLICLGYDTFKRHGFNK